MITSIVSDLVDAGDAHRDGESLGDDMKEIHDGRR